MSFKKGEKVAGTTRHPKITSDKEVNTKMLKPRQISIWVLFMFLLFGGTASGNTVEKSYNANGQSAYLLRVSIIGSAGFPGSSTNYRSNGTLGQSTPVGKGSGANGSLSAGSWVIGWGRTTTGVILPGIVNNELFQNYPNPFNPSTTIKFTVANEGLVQVKVFNVKGEVVRNLVDEYKTPGTYQSMWDGRNDRSEKVATGVYFCSLRIGSFNSTKKMILVK
jgi:hypothetical protein